MKHICKNTTCDHYKQHDVIGPISTTLDIISPCNEDYCVEVNRRVCCVNIRKEKLEKIERYVQNS